MFFTFRYMAIIHPLRPRVTARVIFAIIIIWIVSTMLSFPNLIFSKIFTAYYNDTSNEICMVSWPDGSVTINSIDFW